MHAVKARVVTLSITARDPAENFEMGFSKASQHKVRFGVEAPAPCYIFGMGENVTTPQMPIYQNNPPLSVQVFSTAPGISAQQHAILPSTPPHQHLWVDESEDFR